VSIDECVKGGWFGTSPFVDRLVIVAPAFVGNYYPDRECKPIALVLHEPQEEADDRESTPVWFQNPAAKASTRWYGDNDGDLYQMVPFPASAIANGLDGKPTPRFNDGGPEFGPYSLNMQTDNIEVEGNTHSISRTFNQWQYAGLCDWLVLGYILWDLPRNPGRVLSHTQLSVQRSDGEWVRKCGVVEEAVNRVLKLEKDVKELQALAWTNAQKDNTQDGEIRALFGLAVQTRDKYQAHETHPPGA
jgi:hypothetical protein